MFLVNRSYIWCMIVVKYGSGQQAKLPVLPRGLNSFGGENSCSVTEIYFSDNQLLNFFLILFFQRFLLTYR